MGDEESADKVLKTDQPRAQKALGRKVKNFNEDLWNRNCYDIVKKGNFHKVCNRKISLKCNSHTPQHSHVLSHVLYWFKFTQNEELNRALMETEGTTLVEASPVDKMWGIGLDAESPDAKSYKTWKGTNLLGFALTDVREQIKNSWSKYTTSISDSNFLPYLTSEKIVDLEYTTSISDSNFIPYLTSDYIDISIICTSIKAGCILWQKECMYDVYVYVTDNNTLYKIITSVFIDDHSH